MKILGLDVGEKRIGVAVVDTDVKIAVPLTTITTAGDDEVDQVEKIMKEEETNFVVVGLPRNAKGIETAQSEIVRIFATQLQARGARVKFQDESLTSVEAERRLKVQGKKYSKGDIDKEAAVIILQDFVESQSTKAGSGDRRRREVSVSTDTDITEVKPSARKKNLYKFPIISILVVLAVAGLAAGAIWFMRGSGAVDENMIRQTFVVSSGESMKQIGENLEEAGLVRDAGVFQLAARAKGANVRADTYFLSSSNDVWGIIEEIRQ